MAGLTAQRIAKEDLPSAGIPRKLMKFGYFLEQRSHVTIRNKVQTNYHATLERTSGGNNEL